MRDKKSENRGGERGDRVYFLIKITLSDHLIEAVQSIFQYIKNYDRHGQKC